MLNPSKSLLLPDLYLHVSLVYMPPGRSLLGGCSVNHVTSGAREILEADPLHDPEADDEADGVFRKGGGGVNSGVVDPMSMVILPMGVDMIQRNQYRKY